MSISSSDLRLSAQRALFDRIKPNVRKVSIDLIDNKTITLFFYYDGETTEEDESLAGDAGAEVISDFPGDYMIDWKVTRIDYPETISAQGNLVYKRYEPLL